ncbi:hypothetical protein B0H63DRAFT_39494 [Podospora didyma]|uniref:Septum formation initiator domain-containing protein n=1 Tax=Podospora didyma TaxID=330526 RepID=A0AAE0P722_9PEZI|nr:hypothetical protein B0H63DRAFT_39494 [Podospora didyma]
MSPNGAEGFKAASPHRPRHQITRSISELSSPIRLHRHHSHRAAKEKERDREALAPVPQSVRLSLDGERSEAMTPNLSPNASRRTSILVAPTDDSPGVLVPTTVATTPGPTNAPISKRGSKDSGLVREQQKAVARESGLKRSLTELENLSTSTTRHLDDTYYSVLEKLGALQNTISALKELADLSHQMNDSFSTDAEELVVDVSSQLDAFGQFEDQQDRIETLQGRIHLGREKIKSLSERVDLVRVRIENWERADRDWQERTRRRLKAVWVVTSLVIFLVLLVLASAQYASESLEDTTSRLANGSLQTIQDGIGAGAGAGANTGTKSSTNNNNNLWKQRGEGPDKGLASETDNAANSSQKVDILRVFDEL